MCIRDRILADALITLLLGILVLCNQLVADTSIPMVFGMWVLVSGILRIEAATHINKEKKLTNFRTTTATGILAVICLLYTSRENSLQDLYSVKPAERDMTVCRVLLL